MRIGVIGAGAIGGTLARHLTRLGHQVSIANSRGPDSLTALAAEIGATPVSVVDAAKAGEIVMISIPTKAVADLPRELFANVPSRVVVIDTGNYHPELRDGRIDAIDQGMLDSQWVAQQIGRPLIKAFNKRWVGEGGGDRAAGLGAPAFAGSAPGNVGEIGFGVSQTSVSSDSTGVDSAQFFGVRGGYQIKQEFEIEGQIASSSASGSVAGTGVERPLQLPPAQQEVRSVRDGRHRPRRHQRRLRRDLGQ